MPSICQKLQLKAPYSLLLLNAPVHLPAAFEEEGGTVQAATTTQAQAAYDAVLLFIVTKAELDTLASQAVAALKPNGMLWIAYPKKSAGIKSDMSRDNGWETIVALGYEGVRLVAVDETWSALRFKPKAARKEPSKMGVDHPGIDRAAKTVAVPEDLQLALQQAGVAARFEQLAFTHRKEHVLAVLEAKRPETRQSRIAKVVAKLQAV
ncbi:YdeI/OmpD-associated family protein [Pontibacter sp. Tf4]|uniref:YdeI/OmpD-associated family protein n=1 Tax=Pontibacter sp. Tf4 TaxID=2761620 RepID=UPI001623275B|nr:YdeI/OmpD-associated family protein [Pontibacter sp. Tf4]MBB6609776.1 YdeI/OmpD-associated family protein [Pontibacter sp. Tf4]